MRNEENTVSPTSSRGVIPILVGAMFLVVLCATYSNHFDNEFHFDDKHTIEDNIFIRDLRNLPRIFADAVPFSVLPLNQVYRPIVTASLAVDYWIAGGLRPVYFHASTFLWYLVQLVVMYLLYRGILNRSNGDHSDWIVAALATAWYGLHPVSAETVNYVIQRAEIYAVLGVVSGLLIYQRYPARRGLGLYLLPVMVGALSKPTAVMFAPILFAYILLFEQDSSLCFWQEKFSWRKVWLTAKSCVPAMLLCLCMYQLQARLTSASFSPGGASRLLYLITQPWIYLHYARSLFLPTALTADSDWVVLSRLSDVRAAVGMLFLCVVLGLMVWTSRQRQLRPIAFGLAWFILALVPTSVVPLSEVMNDHRMFFPFVGLVLSVCWAARLVVRWLQGGVGWRPAGAVALVVSLALLPVYAYGTWVRNKVWHSDESLWRDATEKSPQNARALMNYGITLMARSDLTGARDLFMRAFELKPNYYVLEINLGIVEGALKRNDEAERHFRRAIALSPELENPYSFYARWLHSVGRSAEALSNLNSAIAKVPQSSESRYLQMEIHLQQNQWPKVRSVGAELLQLAPNDERTLNLIQRADAAQVSAIGAAEKAVNESPTPEARLQLSFLYYQAERFADCIAEAQRALELRPEYAEAYNNIGSAWASLGKWQEAIAAEEHALSINPQYQLAKNNLNWARSQLGLPPK